MEDVVQRLGYLTLGTRLKRIGERVQADTQKIFESCELTIPVGQWPFIAALDRLGGLTIGELSKAVGVTQPGTTRTVGQLEEAGLVAVVASSGDQRRKEVKLTPQGKKVITAGKTQAWPAIERAVSDLCCELKGPLLQQLTALEDGLTEKPLHLRVPAGRRR